MASRPPQLPRSGNPWRTRRTRRALPPKNVCSAMDCCDSASVRRPSRRKYRRPKSPASSIMPYMPRASRAIYPIAGQDDGQAQAGQHGGLGDDFGQFHGVGTPELVVLGDWRAHFAPSGYYAPKTRKIKPPNKQFSAVMPPPLTLCFIFWCPTGEKTPHKQSRLQVRTSTHPLLALWTRDTVRLSRKISERMSKGILGLESTKNSR